MDSLSSIFTPSFIEANFTPKQVTVKEGDYLFKEGEENSYVYFILDGSIKVIKESFYIGITYSHEFIGITSCLSGKNNYAFTAIAQENSNLLQIHKDNFNRLLSSNAQFCKYMIKILCNRIRLTDLKTTIFLTLTPKRRVIIELLNNTTISEKEVKSNLTLKDLSEMSVVSIRLVKKNMNELEKLGLIKIQEDDSIVIINRKGLEKLEQTT